MTTGGISTSQNWQSMHRSRLVHGLNASFSQKSEPKILGQSSLTTGVYDMAILHPEVFLKNHSDVAFMEAIGCLSNDCSFYHKNLAMVPQTRPSLQFESKFLLDVDGDGFSGQWSAHLQSRSLALKATIFREWHDSRLFAWRHFVPLDNRYHELLSVLTYFMGVGSPDISPTLGSPLVPRHEFEAKRLALQGREWSRKVLRKEDIEVLPESRSCGVILTKIDLHVSITA